MRVGRALLCVTGALTLMTATLVMSPAMAAPSPASGTTSVVRNCTTPAAYQVACFALRRTDVTQPAAIAAHPYSVVPAATPAGFGPADLAGAYKLTTSGGSGQTVAVVDAFDDPNAESDLAIYRSQFGLPACTTANGCFSKVDETGGTNYPPSDTGWAGEISLDVDMVSAVCPDCHILLIEATTANNPDVYTAEDYAAAHARFVSNSWGEPEYKGQTADDTHFNHPGVAIEASAGDGGFGAAYPANSQYVTAVGGTTLATATNARGWTETAWGGTGSGCSAYDAKPSWQTVTTGCSKRAMADVSAVADPSTGVAVYQTFGATGWQIYGGTSVAAPIIASVWALAGAPGATDQAASYPYGHAGSLFDVTSGSNGTCGAPMCDAGAGWDGPTGLGTPNGTAAFTPGSGGTALTLTNPGSQAGSVGAATKLALQAAGGTTPYTFTARGLPVGLSIGSATGVISGTPSAAGNYTVTATVTDAASSSSSVTFSWKIHPSSCRGQLLGNPGFETGSAAPWAATPDVIEHNGAGEHALSGTWFAWLDGYGMSHTDTLSQSVTIPAGCHATLSFWLHIDTDEVTATVAHDRLAVRFGGVTVLTRSNLNAAPGYVKYTFDVSARAGSSSRLLFVGVENATLQTSFVVDDVAVTLS
jgi:hypothetical protein